ncbi:uncharacterized protein BT62DRAFT_726670 [Guyanagaster necrorhizus]|uniref:Uncharacterized protein n=1 Tax=Guyanagaster necrorhizus TaxID=856835 RepID=A0A9P7VY61_9AGAR|nr:uncharacterized protein BT62DRAFT_726670 [Guyanagaster necrorhizus MCA 3950]KAG7448763.1 hypothetical protein BT62DRAFT_726670 [Guyanagaster necrorhizus MCA 3950]
MIGRGTFDCFVIPHRSKGPGRFAHVVCFTNCPPGRHAISDSNLKFLFAVLLLSSPTTITPDNLFLCYKGSPPRAMIIQLSRDPDISKLVRCIEFYFPEADNGFFAVFAAMSGALAYLTEVQEISIACMRYNGRPRGVFCLCLEGFWDEPQETHHYQLSYIYIKITY